MVCRKTRNKRKIAIAKRYALHANVKRKRFGPIREHFFFYWTIISAGLLKNRVK